VGQSKKRFLEVKNDFGDSFGKNETIHNRVHAFVKTIEIKEKNVFQPPKFAWEEGVF
jgi:hypothetical protein